MAEATMPTLTSAEAAVVDHYVAALEYLGRINPARADHTHRALLAAQALASHATRLRDALALMWERGETTIYTDTLVRALHALDADKRVARLAVPPAGTTSEEGL
jgi:hypothetical protein